MMIMMIGFSNWGRGEELGGAGGGNACLDVGGEDGGDEAPPGFHGVPFDGG
jgi:hypothetical protein